MRMSAQFTISVQILVLIAYFADRKLTSQFLSKSTGANPVMVRRLFGKLKGAGILNVSAGRGATTLARPTNEISLWDIYMAVEEYSVSELFKFHPKISDKCKIGMFFEGVLSVHLDDAVQAMAGRLSNISLMQLLDEWNILHR